ncbi:MULTISPECIES: SH3 domain-containing protein [unclassified Streptomyces]|uniref:SH3 domain-containing protein n=1 Tax=unclassified Streptomyces TaxID=2593676 RepID=UPI00342FB1E6
MKYRNKVLAVAALSAGCLTMATGPASAATMITTYEAVNVRDLPDSHSHKEGAFPANYTVLGLCWQWGESITDNGYTNDVWVSTGKKGTTYSFWVSAVYLKGDKYANMPWLDNCGNR